MHVFFKMFPKVEKKVEVLGIKLFPVCPKVCVLEDIYLRTLAPILCQLDIPRPLHTMFCFSKFFMFTVLLL